MEVIIVALFLETYLKKAYWVRLRPGQLVSDFVMYTWRAGRVGRVRRGWDWSFNVMASQA
jgi:hypothetical protein